MKAALNDNPDCMSAIKRGISEVSSDYLSANTMPATGRVDFKYLCYSFYLQRSGNPFYIILFSNETMYVLSGESFDCRGVNPNQVSCDTNIHDMRKIVTRIGVPKGKMKIKNKCNL